MTYICTNADWLSDNKEQTLLNFESIYEGFQENALWNGGHFPRPQCGKLAFWQNSSSFCEHVHHKTTQRQSHRVHRFVCIDIYFVQDKLYRVQSDVVYDPDISGDTKLDTAIRDWYTIMSCMFIINILHIYLCQCTLPLVRCCLFLVNNYN